MAHLERNVRMIPKIIHYVWCGNNPKPDLILNCIKSWKKYCPDYEIKEWNNDDVAKIDNQYVKEAFECKKWAFVSDYLRLFALKKYGGIYLDTDVEVKKTFNDLLHLDFFIGSEKYNNNFNLGTAVIASNKNNDIIKAMINHYQNRHFIKQDGFFDMTPNPIILGNILSGYGITNDMYKSSNSIEFAKNSILYPYNSFCIDNPNCYAVHHFEASWVDAYILKRFAKVPLGKKRYLTYYRFKRKNPKNTFEYPKSIKKILCEFNTKKYKIIFSYNEE